VKFPRFIILSLFFPQVVSTSKLAVMWFSLVDMEKIDVPPILLEEMRTYNPVVEYLLYMEITISKRLGKMGENNCVWRVVRVEIQETQPDIHGTHTHTHIHTNAHTYLIYRFGRIWDPY
jgi:hypothetical protein